MIIAGFSGIGKTTLAKLYPYKVIDFVCMPYKYNLGENEVLTEADKANHDLDFLTSSMRHPKWLPKIFIKEFFNRFMFLS